MTKNQFASYIDHTLLSPDAKSAQIERLCAEALRYGFASVCVNPVYVPLAAQKLAGSAVKVCTVIGFPLGASTTAAKMFEAADAIKNGASEIDMVMDVGAAKDGRFSVLEDDIAGVVRSCRQTAAGITVKVILETCFLGDDEIVSACLCAKNAGADFVKTSTGFASPKNADGQTVFNGATGHHIKLMRETVGAEMGVKASGGIRDVRAAVTMLEAGASRIGTSSGVILVEGWDESADVRARF